MLSRQILLREEDFRSFLVLHDPLVKHYDNAYVRAHVSQGLGDCFADVFTQLFKLGMMKTLRYLFDRLHFL